MMRRRGQRSAVDASNPATTALGSPLMDLKNCPRTSVPKKLPATLRSSSRDRGDSGKGSDHPNSLSLDLNLSATRLCDPPPSQPSLGSPKRPHTVQQRKCRTSSTDDSEDGELAHKKLKASPSSSTNELELDCLGNREDLAVTARPILAATAAANMTAPPNVFHEAHPSRTEVAEEEDEDDVDDEVFFGKPTQREIAVVQRLKARRRRTMLTVFDETTQTPAATPKRDKSPSRVRRHHDTPRRTLSNGRKIRAAQIIQQAWRTHLQRQRALHLRVLRRTIAAVKIQRWWCSLAADLKDLNIQGCMLAAHDHESSNNATGGLRCVDPLAQILALAGSQRAEPDEGVIDPSCDDTRNGSQSAPSTPPPASKFTSTCLSCKETTFVPVPRTTAKHPPQCKANEVSFTLQAPNTVSSSETPARPVEENNAPSTRSGNCSSESADDTAGNRFCSEASTLLKKRQQLMRIRRRRVELESALSSIPDKSKLPLQRVVAEAASSEVSAPASPGSPFRAVVKKTARLKQPAAQSQEKHTVSAVATDTSSGKRGSEPLSLSSEIPPSKIAKAARKMQHEAHASSIPVPDHVKTAVAKGGTEEGSSQKATAPCQPMTIPTISVSTQEAEWKDERSAESPGFESEGEKEAMNGECQPQNDTKQDTCCDAVAEAREGEELFQSSSAAMDFEIQPKAPLPRRSSILRRGRSGLQLSKLAKGFARRGTSHRGDSQSSADALIQLSADPSPSSPPSSSSSSSSSSSASLGGTGKGKGKAKSVPTATTLSRFGRSRKMAHQAEERRDDKELRIQTSFNTSQNSQYQTIMFILPQMEDFEAQEEYLKKVEEEEIERVFRASEGLLDDYEPASRLTWGEQLVSFDVSSTAHNADRVKPVSILKRSSGKGSTAAPANTREHVSEQPAKIEVVVMPKPQASQRRATAALDLPRHGDNNSSSLSSATNGRRSNASQGLQSPRVSRSMSRLAVPASPAALQRISSRPRRAMPPMSPRAGLGREGRL